MNNPAIINASPLIFFSRARQMPLLRRFADAIWVPEPVANEIKMKGSQDITVKVLETFIRFGLYLSKSVIDEALKRVDE